METFGYKSIDVAGWFITTINIKTGESITNLKLQKLVYYAQAWTLVFLNKSLFKEDFEAWAYGPVMTSLYNRFRDYRNEEVPVPRKRLLSKIDDDNVLEVLNEVLDVYGDKSGYHLIDLTHSEKPWIDARGNLPSEAKCNNIIPKESMMKYYSQKLEESN